jgi:hypothetical protein
MGEPREKIATEADVLLASARTPLALTVEHDWWNGWRLDEPADSVIATFDEGTDWWSGWHAALLRER